MHLLALEAMLAERPAETDLLPEAAILSEDIFLNVIFTYPAMLGEGRASRSHRMHLL